MGRPSPVTCTRPQHPLRCSRRIHNSPSTGPKVGRSAAAKKAGMSERQRKTALRVANVPKEQFEKQVESENPPTVTKLAQHVTVAAAYGLPEGYLGSRTPEQVQTATHLIGVIDYVLRGAKNIKLDVAVPGLRDDEAEELLGKIDIIRTWLGEVEKEITHE